MTAWRHHPTNFDKQKALQIASILAIFVAFITTLFLANAAHAVASTDKTINFQGRLLDNAGKPVANGRYNIEFKIYQGGTGVKVSNPDGQLKWSEAYLNKNSNSGVEVKNGYFAVNLGSVVPFADRIDWSQSALWLSMNVAGMAANCTSFGSSLCVADGEMLPMKRITASPFAINSGQLGGKTAENFTQLGQGVQVDNGNASSIFINKTGTGNLIQLQSNGNDNFTVSNSGDISLGGQTDKSITVAASADQSDGKNLTISAGGGGNGDTTGGDLVLTGGSAGSGNANGGNITLAGGNGSGDGANGLVILATPTFATTTTDSNCFTDGKPVSDSCIVSQKSIDNSAAIIVGLKNIDKTVNLPEPTQKLAGRIIYIIAAGDSVDFGLKVNTSTQIAMKKNTATTIIWSGTMWVSVTGSGASNDLPATSDSISLPSTPSVDGVIEQPNQSTSGDQSLVVTSNETSPTLSSTNPDSYISDGDFIDSDNFTKNWQTQGDTVVKHEASHGYLSSSSVSIATNGQSNDGIKNILAKQPKTNSKLIVSFFVESIGNFDLSNLQARYSPDDGATYIICDNLKTTPIANVWTEVSCTINTGNQKASKAILEISQKNNSTKPYTFSIDRVEINDSTPDKTAVATEESANTTQAPFKLESSAQAPNTNNSQDLLGSMYYDTTLGKVRCYEASGWGPCADSPDTFATISPEYTNAVMNGNDIGTISSDLCSDSLNINDGSNDQPSICGKNQTFNFYKWTSTEKTPQTRSIFVTYRLPGSFKKFVAGSTSIMANADSNNANVSYQIYQDNQSGLIACGEQIKITENNPKSWLEGVANDNNDPANCSFKPGESILLRINLTASQGASAYVGNISFTFNNN